MKKHGIPVFVWVLCMTSLGFGQEGVPSILVGNEEGAEILIYSPGEKLAAVAFPSLGKETRVPLDGTGIARARVPVPLHGKKGFKYTIKIPGRQPVRKTADLFPLSGNGSVTLCIYGDSRGNVDIHAGILKQMARLSPWFIINAGDMVSRPKKISSWVKEFLEPIAGTVPGTSLYTVKGNHDCGGKLYSAFCTRGKGGKTWWKKDFTHLVIFGLDTNGNLKPGSEQWRWLSKNLEKTRGSMKWRMVVMHHPPFSTCLLRPTRRSWSMDFHELVERNRVDIVVSGHDHLYMRTVPIRNKAYKGKNNRGVIYVITGGGGAGLHLILRRKFVAKAERTHHFLFIKAGRNKLEGKAIDTRGKVIDSWVLSRKKHSRVKPYFLTTPGKR